MNRSMTSVVMIALALLLALPLTAAAQEPDQCPLGQGDGPGMKGQGPPQRGLLGRLGEELELTDEQKEQIQAIMAEEMPAARERIEERVAEVLTSDQQSKLEQLKEEHPAMVGKGRGRGMRGPGGPGGPGARLERMAEALELTDDQQDAIREIIAEDRQEKRSEVQEKIDGVLTPEQQEKMEDLHEERRARMTERRGR